MSARWPSASWSPCSPNQAERARAIAVFSFTGAAGASIGQVLGGVLTDALTWHWIFFINLPIGLAVLLVAVRVLPADRGGTPRSGRGGRPPRHRRPDARDLHGRRGGDVRLGLRRTRWASARSPWPCWRGYVLRQATAPTPLMPLRILRSRNVSGANVVQMLMVAALFSFQIIVALYLQKVLGYGAAATGLAMLPAAVVIGAVTLGLSARLVARFGERAVLLTGIGLLIAALGLLARLPVRADYVTDLLPVMLLLAAGLGLALPALTSLGMSGAGEDDAGLASGLFNTTQQIGMALGVAVLSTLAAGRTEALTAAGRPSAEALTGGYQAGVHHLARHSSWQPSPSRS
ncbi:MFS transporter OS=Streptomyces microflavus OX=1919 GN=Smic_43400 PE=4 SV=1 [Streptomyces microflavus]